MVGIARQLLATGEVLESLKRSVKRPSALTTGFITQAIDRSSTRPNGDCAERPVQRVLLPLAATKTFRTARCLLAWVADSPNRPKAVFTVNRPLTQTLRDQIIGPAVGISPQITNQPLTRRISAQR